MQELVIREYLEKKIEFKMIDGEVYANANTMTDSVKLDNWKRSAVTKRYIEALERKMLKTNEEKENSSSVKNTNELILSKRGSHDGTWIHEKLVLSLARYISVEFEIWCDEQIATLIREGSVSLKPMTDEEHVLALLPNAKDFAYKFMLAMTKEVDRLTVDLGTANEKIRSLEDVINDMVGNTPIGTLRKRLDQMIKADSIDGQFGARYKYLYQEIEQIHGISVNKRWGKLKEKAEKDGKKMTMSKLDILEFHIMIDGKHVNMIPEAFKIACRLFPIGLEKLKNNFNLSEEDFTILQQKA